MADDASFSKAEQPHVAAATMKPTKRPHIIALCTTALLVTLLTVQLFFPADLRAWFAHPNARHGVPQSMSQKASPKLTFTEKADTNSTVTAATDAQEYLLGVGKADITG